MSIHHRRLLHCARLNSQFTSDLGTGGRVGVLRTAQPRNVLPYRHHHLRHNHHCQTTSPPETIAEVFVVRPVTNTHRGQLSLSLSLSVSVCLSVSLCLSLSVSLSVCLSLSVS